MLREKLSERSSVFSVISFYCSVAQKIYKLYTCVYIVRKYTNF